MLRPLRWKLTITFLAATLLLVLLLGGSAYFGINRFLRSSVDLNLMYRMATEFRTFGFELPHELSEAEQAWVLQEGPSALASGQSIDSLSGFEDEYEDEEAEGEHHELEESYAHDVILTFTLPLNENGELLFNPNPYAIPINPDTQASLAALSDGTDLRDVRLANGERVRLLTYRTEPGALPALIQVGRVLGDQDRILMQIAGTVAVAGFAILMMAGLVSWWLAGRTLEPAQRAWDRQQTFVANASHELRTPLTLMRASVEVALRQKLGKKETGLLTDVLEETDYMSRLVDDLLLLSRMDGGRVELDLEPLSVGELLSEIESEAQKLKHARQSVNIDDKAADAKVLADKARLRQVLLILLDNAIRHNPADTPIAIRSSRQGDQLELRVEDQGLGIPDEHLTRIFERFYQIPGNHKDARSNGLGLSIAKGLVELHKGTIAAESAAGGGTSFLVRLPLYTAS